MLLCTINPMPWNIQMEMCAFCLLFINDLQSFDGEFKWKLYSSIEVEEFRDIVLLTALSIAFRVILNETNRVWDLYSVNDVGTTQFKGRGIDIKVSSAYTQHFFTLSSFERFDRALMKNWISWQYFLQCFSPKIGENKRSINQLRWREGKKWKITRQ